AARPRGGTALRFEVTIAPGLVKTPQNGRLYVLMGIREDPEPREFFGEAGMGAPPMLGRDVNGLAPGMPAVVDGTAASFPIAGLSKLPARQYFVQAAFASNPDLRIIDAPGNLYSEVQPVYLDPAHGGTVAIQLTGQEGPEHPPADSEYVKYVRLRSELLSRFHG